MKLLQTLIIVFELLSINLDILGSACSLTCANLKIHTNIEGVLKFKVIINLPYMEQMHFTLLS